MRIGIYAAAVIVDRRTQEELDLTELANNTSFLTGVEVTRALDSPHRVSVTLDMPYREGIRFLDDGWLAVGNFIKVRFGYPVLGYLSPWRSAIIQVPQVSLGLNGLTATVIGDSSAGLAMLSESGRSWEGTPWSMVSTLARKHGLQIDDEDGQARLALSEESAWAESQGATDDWMFMRQVCSRRGVMIWGGTNSEGRAALMLRRRSAKLESTPKRTFALMAGVDRLENRYPVISFSVLTKQETIFAAGSLRGTRLQEMADDGSIIITETSVSANPEQTLSEGVPVTGNGDASIEPDTGALSDSDPTDGGTDTEAAGSILHESPAGVSEDYVQEHMQRGFVGIPGTEVSITTVGIPEQELGDIVSLEGASSLFDGNYQVKSITESVTNGGYEMIFTGFRNGVGLAGQEQSPNVNRREALSTPDTVEEST